MLSFILLAGKCRFCHKPISIQYPLVESATAFLFWLSSAVFGKDLYQLGASFVFVGFLVLLTASDLKWRLLPHPFNNLFILAGFPLGVGGLSLAHWFAAAGGLLVVGFFFFGLVQIFPSGMGGGDIKMAAGFAAWVGLEKAFLMLLLAFLLGLVFVLVQLGRGRLTLKSYMAFGPALASGALVVWFWPDLIQRTGIFP